MKISNINFKTRLRNACLVQRVEMFCEGYTCISKSKIEYLMPVDEYIALAFIFLRDASSQQFLF